MTDRPIIFSAPMIQALLDERKTQTRRVLKPPYGTLEYLGSGQWRPICLKFFRGDRLWVREAWVKDGDCPLQYKAGPHVADDALGVRWRSPIHMPRWASRLTLTVTDVRVQRLRDISEDDAIAEGIKRHGHAFTGYGKDADRWMTARDSFASLWTSIHGPDAFEVNPWVCALTFTVEKRNINAPAAMKGS